MPARFHAAPVAALALLLGAAAPAAAVEIFDQPPDIALKLGEIACTPACDAMTGVQYVTADAPLPAGFALYDPIPASVDAGPFFGSGFYLSSSGAAAEKAMLDKLLLAADPGGVIYGPTFPKIELTPDVSGVLLDAGWYAFKFGAGGSLDLDPGKSGNQGVDTAFVYAFGLSGYTVSDDAWGGLSHISYMGGICLLPGCGDSSIREEIPLPAALPLMGAGLAALAFVARRRRAAA